MGKLVCIGGGEIPRVKNGIKLPYETREIDEEIVRITEKENPKLLFIGTASTKLVVFGDKDECVLTQDIETVKVYLNNNIKNCNIQTIKGANHSYTDKYEELGQIIEQNI